MTHLQSSPWQVQSCTRAKDVWVWRILFLLLSAMSPYLLDEVESYRPSPPPPPPPPPPDRLRRRSFLNKILQGSSMLGTTTSIVCLSSSNLLHPAFALTPNEASRDYNRYAQKYDELDGGSAADMLGIDAARKQLFAKASGRVLEVGAGTGLNLSKYDPTQLTSLTLLDVSKGMLDQAEIRYRQEQEQSHWKNRNIVVNFVEGDATNDLVSLFGTKSFDTVVDSFSLCVMGNQGAVKCLDQMRQVIKPGGKILLLENSRASNPILGAYQDATADAAASAGGKGCVYNQNVRSMIEDTDGLFIEKEESYAAGFFRAFECRVE